MRRPIRLVPLLFAVAAAACDLLGSDGPNLTFDFARMSVPDSAQSSAIVLAGNNVFTVDGVMIAPNDCQNLRAEMQLGSGTITMIINARQVISACETTRGAFAYRATTSMNEGVYQLKVIHIFGAAQPAETVLDTQITIR